MRVVSILGLAVLCLFAAAQSASAQNPSCPPAKLIVGAAGHVTADHSVNMRATPSTRGKLLFAVGSGETFIVISGPECIDGYQWWLVNWNSVQGWLPEGFGNDYWLEALPAGGKQPTPGRFQTATPSVMPVGTAAPDTQPFLPKNLQKITAANAAQLKQVATWGRGSLNGMALSPDGKTLAVATGTGIYLYPADNLNGTPRLLRSGARIFDLAFSPDGTKLATVGTALQIWEVATGSVLATFEGNAGKPATGVAVIYSPDGQYLATINGNYTAPQIWDIASTSLKATISGFTQLVMAIAFSTDGKWLVSTGLDKKLIITDAATGTTVQSSPLQMQAFSLAFTPDNRTLALGENNGVVELRDTATWQSRQTLREQRGQISSVQISTDGNLIAAASEEGTAVIWNLRTLNKVTTLKIGFPLRGSVIQLSPDGKTIYVGQTASVSVWNTADGTQQQQFAKLTPPISSLHFSGDGKWLATSNADGTARLWDVTKADQTLVFNVPGAQTFGVALDETGKTLVASGLHDVSVFDVAKGAVRLNLSKQNQSIFAVAYSPEQKRIAASSFDGAINLWDSESGKLISSLTEDALTATALRAPLFFTSDDKWLVSKGLDNIRVRDAQTGVVQVTFTTNTRPTDMAVSPDSQTIGYTSSQGIVLLDIASQAQTQVIEAAGGLGLLTFSADGSLIASTLNTQTLRAIMIFDTKSGQQVMALPGLSVIPEAIAFSPDGTLLAAGGRDGVITLWGIVP